MSLPNKPSITAISAFFFLLKFNQQNYFFLSYSKNTPQYISLFFFISLKYHLFTKYKFSTYSYIFIFILQILITISIESQREKREDKYLY